MAHLRISTIDLFRIHPKMLTFKGTANQNEFSVMAMGFIIAGNENHHRKVLMERYLECEVMRLLIVGLAGMLGACVSPLAFKRQLTAAEEKFNDHIGFVLYDPGSRKTLIEFNSETVFHSRSNTKIFTFYTALQIWGTLFPP